MGLASTSLISNLWPSLVGGLFLLGSCSTPPPTKSEDEESINLAQELENLGKKVKVQDYGPFLKEGGAFVDKTEGYGLSNLSAVNFNAVDLNFDGHTDLVLLPNYCSNS